ncbi:hypothetical protein ACSLBF_17770 (plasmid) [Pseudoalteromonas sp. T1lg65]|uniref:hypothetical protein n=1 Tax=Pseudoalteromonas sp. T1lg65 TaxID=2077101 RepID=UPI003F7B1578
MKVKIVIAIVCTAVVSFLGFNMYTVTDTEQPVAKGTKIEIKKHAEQKILDTKKNEASSLQRLDETLKQAKKLSTREGVVANSGSIDTLDRERYFEFVVKSFPQLEEQVNEYRQALKVQEEHLHILAEKMSKRNKDVELTGAHSSSLDENLIKEQEKLILKARELGKQAMVLNAAIRKAAFDS